MRDFLVYLILPVLFGFGFLIWLGIHEDSVMAKKCRALGFADGKVVNVLGQVCFTREGEIRKYMGDLK